MKPEQTSQYRVGTYCLYTRVVQPSTTIIIMDSSYTVQVFLQEREKEKEEKEKIPVRYPIITIVVHNTQCQNCFSARSVQSANQHLSINQCYVTFPLVVPFSTHTTHCGVPRTQKIRSLLLRPQSYQSFSSSKKPSVCHTSNSLTCFRCCQDFCLCHVFIFGPLSFIYFQSSSM